MDEKVIALLGVVVRQNAELLKQNREVIDFVKARDALVPERHALEIAHLKQELGERSAMLERYNATLAALGVGRGDIQMIEVLKGLGIYDAGKAVRERLKAAGTLPEKTDV